MNHQINVPKELATLKRMAPSELRTKFAEVFGEPSRSANKDFLVRRIIWRMQALAEGNLAERARQRALEMANDADLRLRPPTTPLPPRGQPRGHRLRLAADDRLPIPGTVLTREYRGQTIEVKVLDRGFEYAGEKHKTLSAVTRAITGQHMSGPRFFGLVTPKERKR